VISEQQLQTWSAQGATPQFTDTYNRIRNSLLDGGAPYPLADTKVFLQGSYKNDTNVYGDSDVDVILLHSGAFYYDVSRLPPADGAAFKAALNGVQYGYPEFKREATAYVSRLYNNVNIGGKAIYVPGGNSGRRDADILIASRFRRYHEFRSWQSDRYEEGICFRTPSGSLIENYPEQHSNSCTAKHQATNGRFKPMVRVFKNMRNAMIQRGTLAEGAAPSYFIEGMLYNVPNQRFGGTLQETWLNCLNHVVTAKTEDLTTANGMFWLVRDNTPTSWSSANFNGFLHAALEFWAAH
jgi:hypothetical protein